MRKTILAILLLLSMLCAAACAEGMITASVQVRASRSVYDSVIRTGEDIDMSVSIDGFTPTLCQWYFEDAPIEGANETTLHIESADTADTGMYRMDAMDADGKIRVSVDVAIRVVDYTIPKTGDPRASRIPLMLLTGAAALGIAFVGKKQSAADKFLTVSHKFS